WSTRRLVLARHGRVLRPGLQQRPLVVELGLPVVGGELVLAGHPQRLRRARLDAEAAEDAAQHVDLVDLGVALAFRDAVRLGVLAGNDSDAVGGTRRRAERSPNALLEAVLVPVPHVPATEARAGDVVLL